MRLFLTGATGRIGRALLARLLAEERCERIYVLVRPEGTRSPETRLRRIAELAWAPEEMAAFEDKVEVLRGDVRRPGLGLDSEQQSKLWTVDQVLHLAADTRPDRPLGELRETNVQGTRHVLELCSEMATRGALRRIDHVSTAYCAAAGPGVLSEHAPLPVSVRPPNRYERSKHEAEQMVRSFQDRLAVAIHRPSLVAGAGFGLTRSPLPVRARTWVRDWLPGPLAGVAARGPRTAPLDVVSLDFVIEALAALLRHPGAAGQCFHLTAGAGREIQLEDKASEPRYARIAAKEAALYRLFELLEATPASGLFPDRFLEAEHGARPYRTYLRWRRGARFDNRATMRTLEELGVPGPQRSFA